MNYKILKIMLPFLDSGFIPAGFIVIMLDFWAVVHLDCSLVLISFSMKIGTIREQK